jgi:hypothetical protein
MLDLVALVRTDVSEKRSASIILTRIGEVRTTLAVTNNRRMLRRNTLVSSSLILATVMMEAVCSSETLVHTRVTRRNVSEDGIIIVHFFQQIRKYLLL